MMQPIGEHVTLSQTTLGVNVNHSAIDDFKKLVALVNRSCKKYRDRESGSEFDVFSVYPDAIEAILYTSDIVNDQCVAD